MRFNHTTHLELSPASWMKLAPFGHVVGFALDSDPEVFRRTVFGELLPAYICQFSSLEALLGLAHIFS